MFKRFLLFLSLLSVTIIFAPPVAAFETGDVVMSISPSEQDLVLRPGQTFSGSIEVKNNGRLPFDFVASAMPFSVTDSNYNLDFTTESSNTLIHKWITFSAPSYHVEPGQSVPVKFEIKVPLDVSGGGQYAAIIVRTDDSIDSDALVQISSQLASLLYARIEGGTLREDGRLSNHTLPGFILGSKFAVSATIENIGNVSFRARQTMTIRDFFTGKEVVTPSSVASNEQPLGTNSFVIFPGTSRTSILNWDGAPQLGIFRVQQTISFLKEEYLYDQIVIVCPIWLIGAIIILIVLLMLWLILRSRKLKNHSASARL